LLAVALPAAALVGCSAGPATPPQIFATAAPQPTATPAPSASPGASASPSASPSSSAAPSPTPTGGGGPQISADLSAIDICAQTTQTCASDLNANAPSGEEAVVLVKGATGTVSASNSGGASEATIATQVYATQGSAIEYEVTYTTATASAGNDVLTVRDSGTASSLTIPVTILAPGDDTGASFFALDTTSGAPCTGTQMTFGTRTKGNATITLASSDSTLVSIAQNGGNNFVLTLSRAGSGYVTASAGSSTVIYPANIAATGFASGC